MEERLKKQEQEILCEHKKKQQDAYIKYLRNNNNHRSVSPTQKDLQKIKNQIQTAYGDISNLQLNDQQNKKPYITQYNIKQGSQPNSSHKPANHIEVAKPIPLKDYYDNLQKNQLKENASEARLEDSLQPLQQAHQAQQAQLAQQAQQAQLAQPKAYKINKSKVVQKNQSAEKLPKRAQHGEGRESREGNEFEQLMHNEQSQKKYEHRYQ